MIISVNEQFDVSTEWFNKENDRNSAESWRKRLRELLLIYKLHDVAERKRPEKS